MVDCVAEKASPLEMGAVKQYGLLYVALEGELPGGAGKIGKVFENGHSEQSFLRMLDSYLDKQELVRFYRVEKALESFDGDPFFVDDVVGDAKSIFHEVCGRNGFVWGEHDVRDFPVVIGAEGVQAQTVFGYGQLPIVVIPPCLPTTYTTLVIVHEFAHALHLQVSTRNNPIQSFLPDRLVAETLANAFQREALETESILKYYGNSQVELLKVIHAEESLRAMETALRKKSYIMSVGAGPYNRGGIVYDTMARGGHPDVGITMARLCGGKDEFACFKEALTELESAIEVVGE